MDNFPQPNLIEIVALAPKNIKTGYVCNDSSKNSFQFEDKYSTSKPITIFKMQSSYAANVLSWSRYKLLLMKSNGATEQLTPLSSECEIVKEFEDQWDKFFWLHL